MVGFCAFTHPAGRSRSSSRRCARTATRLTRQQMIDLGLLPPKEGGKVQQADRSLDLDVDVAEGGAELEGEEEPDAIGLIGHFEARQLLAQQRKEGEFVGSLDMSMTTRDLVSTEEGVGEEQKGQYGVATLGTFPMVPDDRQPASVLIFAHSNYAPLLLGRRLI